MRLLLLILLFGLLFLSTAIEVDSKDTNRVYLKNTSLTESGGGPPAHLLGKRPGPSRTPDLPEGCGGTSVSASSYRTFGHVNYATGEAVEGRVWTFDHGDFDPFEGCRSYDLTANDFTAFRHITSAIWSGHGNVPSAPIIDGSGSAWMGFFEDEADGECWKAGLGYGNGWRQRMISPTFYNSSGAVSISFDYYLDAENTYDYIRFILDRGTSLDTLAELTGVDGTYSSPVTFDDVIEVSGTFNLLFEFESDGSYSDEDSLYATTLSAFGVDVIEINGIEGVSGPWPPYDFESSLEGWRAEAIPGAGSMADVNNVAGYVISDSICGLAGNVVSFHDKVNKHPAGQYERFMTNRVDLSSYGDDSLSIFAQYDLYTYMPLGGAVSWTWGFVYFPYICPATGDSIWSPAAGPPYYFYASSPDCETIRSFANDTSAPGKYASGTILVPADSDSIRFFIDIRCDSTAQAGNFTPLLDNIFIGVGRSSIIYVPSPAYPDIQAGINAAATGDTVLVAAGTYVGDSNRNLDFGGTDVVVMSESGPDATVIDCTELGRGFYFNSGESDAAIVDGFTITRGDPSLDGNAILVGSSVSSPVIRNCKIVANKVTYNDAGVVRVENGDPRFECCTVALDSTAESSGLVIVKGGNPVFDNCYIIQNQAVTECVELSGGTPTFTNCMVDNNTASSAVKISTAATLVNSVISNNSNIGMYFEPAGASTVDTCQVLLNVGTGLVMEANSSIFTNCNFQENGGGGMRITGVLVAASPDGEPGEADGIAAAPTAGTAPQFTNCTFTGNVNTSTSGGGIFFDCTNIPVTTFAPIYTNCTITGNSSVLNGGGIAICGTALYTDIAPMFISCTIASNNAGVRGGGIYMGVSASGGSEGIVTADYTILWGNCSTGQGSQAYTETGNVVLFDCSDIDSSGIRGDGEISYSKFWTFEDPAFCQQAECDPAGTIEGLFTLYTNSPADTFASPCGVLIGAHPTACEPSTSVKSTPETPSETVLLPNVPNPFNPTTSIRFDVARSGPVTLFIYDVSGRLVRSLVDRVLVPDRYAVTWDGTDDRGRLVATGVYFSRLQTADAVRTRKLVLIK